MNNAVHHINNKCVDVKLTEPLSLSARKNFISGLKHEPGIKHLEFSKDNPYDLKVTYVSSAFGMPTLVDIIRSHNANVKVVSNEKYSSTV